MSDRTSMTVIIDFGRAPTDAERETFELIESYYYGQDWNIGNNETDLGFGIEEQTVGDSQYIFQRLREDFPDAAEITVWEDPKYEWLGALWHWKKGMGEPFTADCDAYGTVVVTETAIRTILAHTDDAEVRRALRRTIGD